MGTTSVDSLKNGAWLLTPWFGYTINMSSPVTLSRVYTFYNSLQTK